MSTLFFNQLVDNNLITAMRYLLFQYTLWIDLNHNQSDLSFQYLGKIVRMPNVEIKLIFNTINNNDTVTLLLHKTIASRMLHV
jgi:hypothetical protein